MTSVRVLNSGFDDLANVAIDLNDSVNFNSIGNYFGSVGGFFYSTGNNYNVSLGDYYKNSNLIRTGLNLGNLQISSSQQYTISSTPLVLMPVSNTAAAMRYEVRSGANARIGTFNYTKTGSAIVYDDSFNETNISVNANISANNDSILVSLTSGTATFKFNYQTFI